MVWYANIDSSDLTKCEIMNVCASLALK